MRGKLFNPHFHGKEYVTEQFLRACEEVDIETIKYLLDRGYVNVDVKFYGETPLFSACGRKNLDIVELLVSRGADVNFKKDCNNETALHQAVYNEDLEITKLLLENGADVSCEKIGKPQCTPILIAVQKYALYCSEFDDIRIARSHKLLQVLLKYGCQLKKRSMSLKDMKISHRYYRICKAIYDGDENLVGAMLNSSDDVFCGDSFQCSLLQMAICLRRPSIVEMLLKNGTPMKFRQEDLSPFQLGYTEIAEIFIQNGFDVNSRREILTELNYAIVKGHFEVVKLMVENQVDLGAQDCSWRKWTSLHYAVANQRFDISKYLLEQGFDVNSRNINGETPLHFCQSDCKIFSLLLEYGADSRIPRHSDNQTPSHVCQCPKKCPVVCYFKKISLIDKDWVDSRIEKVLPEVTNWIKIREKRIDCYKNEIDKLKSVRISTGTAVTRSMTLFDYMFFKPNLAARYSKNIVLQEIYRKNNENFCNKFPYYGFILNYQYKKGIMRNDCINIITDLINFSSGYHLNDIRDYIYEHFNNKELKHHNDHNFCKEMSTCNEN